MTWDRYFLDIAATVATKSKDPSTKVGAVIVDRERVIRSTGFNGFPRGVADDHRLHDRELKYPIVVHAEMNAVCAAARVGVPLLGCSIYVTLPPCSRCAGLLVQSGIEEVVWPAGLEVPERWLADMTLATRLMAEAGLGLRQA